MAQVARRDVPTCSLREPLSVVRGRLRASDLETCIVLNDAGIVLGRVDERALDDDGASTVEEVMLEAPTTFRPNVTVHEMAEYMHRREIEDALVTDSEGRLIGLLLRTDVEAAHGGAEHGGAVEDP